MPLNGSGTYTPPAPEFPAIPNTLIKASDFNAIVNDIAAALSQAVFRDGQVAFIADQSMGGFKLRNLANALLDQDATPYKQMTDYVTAQIAISPAPGVILTSIAALRALSYSTNTKAFLLGYYASGDGGGGAYYYDSADTTSTDNGGTIIVAADGGRWKLVWTEVLSVQQFGAKSDGVMDCTAALQAALGAAEGGAIYFPPGTYLISSTLVVPFVNATSGSQVVAPRIIGAGMSLTTIICDGAFPAFVYVGGGTFAEMGELAHLRIEGEYGVKIGDRTALTSDVGGGGAYKQRWHCHHVEFRGATADGIGIDASKLFKSKIEQCHFSSIGTGILLAGCDNNTIEDNSIRGSRYYGVFERSAQTFGSQNIIRGNEILGNTGTSTIYIKSASRHVIVENNYIETDTHAVTIDLTDIDSPAWFGSNATQGPYTIRVTGNRIEGGNNATIAQYRIDRDSAFSITVDDAWQGGDNWGSGVWTDSSGNTVTTLKPVVNGAATQVVNLGYSGSCFGREWAHFHTTLAPQDAGADLTIPMTEFVAASPSFANNADIRVNAVGWVLPASWNTANTARLLFEEVSAFASGGAEWLTNGQACFLEFEAKTDHASGDTMTAAFGYYNAGWTGSTAKNCTLTQRFQRFRLQFTPASGFSNPGVLLGRSTSNGNVTVRGIRVQRPVVSVSPIVAMKTVDATNVTGDGTAYTIIFNSKIDAGSNLDGSTGVFTAPYTGKYHFDTCVWVGNIGAGHTNGELDLVTTARTYKTEFNPAALKTSNSRCSVTAGFDCDMTAGDTAYVRLTIHNSTKTVTVQGSNTSNTGTRLTCHLIENSGAA